MNIYPGQGLTIDTAILGSNLGQEYSVKAAEDLCKIHGVLLDIQGGAAGVAGSTLQTINGVLTLVSTWSGVKVTATIAVADVIGGNVVTIEKVDTTTNESGYFELFVLQGLTAIVTCSVFGKSLTVDTTGHTSIDISSLF